MSLYQDVLVLGKGAQPETNLKWLYNAGDGTKLDVLIGKLERIVEYSSH